MGLCFLYVYAHFEIFGLCMCFEYGAFVCVLIPFEIPCMCACAREHISRYFVFREYFSSTSRVTPSPGV